ncbi:MAG TPA: DegT/DnrJ/EryC1/StrS family aminotransferase [Acetobacteraceae bacterium]|nr:DegT/DnrJ/EryC1/StrS family aminotransferase [Acetobacteraceae bacterium]
MNEIAFSRPYFTDEEAEAAAAAVRSFWVVGGPRLREFEAGYAAACGAAHGVGVSSWTTGGFLLLKALGIGPGDEVIVPSLTFIASVNVIVHAGATPVFAEIDPHTYNIDPDDIEARITNRTRAILPVDQIGLPCEIDRINAIAARHGLLVIQDAACSVGARFRGRPVGALAPMTVFSLHARKLVTTGEGGMILTDDGELAARLRRLRHQGMSLSDYERHGSSPTNFESYPEIGYNFRITDVQAAIGVVQLRRLPEMLQHRRAVAERYTAALSNHPRLEPPFVPAHVQPNWQSYQVRLRPGAPLGRNQLMEALHAQGIPTRRGVMASHLEAPYRAAALHLPQTESAAAECLQLPIHPALEEADVELVLSAIDRAFAEG